MSDRRRLALLERRYAALYAWAQDAAREVPGLRPPPAVEEEKEEGPLCPGCFPLGPCGRPALIDGYCLSCESVVRMEAKIAAKGGRKGGGE